MIQCLNTGGFIWDFIDQGLALPGGGYGYGGDFGDFPNTKQFCINGILGNGVQFNVIYSFILLPRNKSF